MPTKPFPVSTEQIKRLLKAKRMTICVGVLSGDGIVIAADTEETSGDAKRDQQKLFHFSSGDIHPDAPTPPGTTAILTGAGEAGYLDAFFYLLSKDASTCQGIDQFEKYMSEELLLFHEKHIFPISEPRESPQIIQVLAAVTCGWNTSLFVTNGSTVRKALMHTAIGYGCHFAQNLLNLWSWCKTLREAQLLAAYVVYATKAHVVACGLHTSISSLHNCVVEYGKDGKSSFRQPSCLMEVGFDHEILRKWETSFDTKWKARQKSTLSELFTEELQATGN